VRVSLTERFEPLLVYGLQRQRKVPPKSPPLNICSHRPIFIQNPKVDDPSFARAFGNVQFRRFGIWVEKLCAKTEPNWYDGCGFTLIGVSILLDEPGHPRIRKLTAKNQNSGDVGPVLSALV
jgi:hypothetical protein